MSEKRCPRCGGTNGWTRSAIVTSTQVGGWDDLVLAWDTQFSTIRGNEIHRCLDCNAGFKTDVEGNILWAPGGDCGHRCSTCIHWTGQPETPGAWKGYRKCMVDEYGRNTYRSYGKNCKNWKGQV